MKPDGPDQSLTMRAFIEREHFRYQTFGDDQPGSGEIRIDDDWRLVMDVTPCSLVDTMVSDFRTFCRECMRVAFSEPASASAKAVRWHCDAPYGPVDPQDPGSESFTIVVADDGITIGARYPRGLVHGTHYLERLLADRGVPILARQHIERTPVFSPRITNSIFIESRQNLRDPHQFSDEYLGLMSHFGNNGIHLYADLWDLCRTSIFPELNAPDFDAHVASLNQLCARANARAIDVYLCLGASILPGEHGVFQAHPEIRGALTDPFDSDLNRFCLCSGDEQVLSFYDEAIDSALRAMPDVAGLIYLVGGEGFAHCYTRPRPPYGGRSSCPRCAERDPSTEVARLVNRAAATVKATGRHKSFYAWPYSAFVWSGSDDRSQTAWIDQLSEDVSVIANFATGSPDAVNGDGVYLYDYNIKSIGPSEIYVAQQERLATQGKPIYAKVESCTTPMFFCTPYLPVPFRWHQRSRAMAELPVAGFIGQWRFYGMNGSLPEELQYHATWNPQRSTDDLLCQAARRDFGVDGETAAQVVRAWEQLGKAWDDLPYSALLCGERAYYMRGPMYLGPAHPLIMNPQNHYGLSHKFRTLRADISELHTAEEVAALAKNAPPRYVDQLMMALPYGEDRFCELIARCRAGWEDAMNALRPILIGAGTERARMELDVCETVGIHLASVDHVARFYRTRDRIWRERADGESVVAAIGELDEIARAEIENASRSLPILERDPRIAYNHCYGNPYDADMVREKIRQCETVIETELPTLSRGLRFHLWMEFP
jgi:hypothetical protein